MGPLDKILELEACFKNESIQLNETYNIIHGNTPVIISAPHSVTHFREGKTKFGEFMTGVIAKLLQERLDCYCITKIKNDLTDPNYDSVHPYKDDIIDLASKKDISFLIDLHIMASERPPAIEIGTGKGRNVFFDDRYAKVIKESFEKNGIVPVIVDEHFTGGNKNTVSSSVSRGANIPCIQIEINWKLINVENNDHQFFAVLDSLLLSIDTLRSLK